MWPPIRLQKTVTKFLYWGFISIFEAPARLLSDRGTSFNSSIIQELCDILGIQWLQTMPYHPQANGLVERLHQTIMHMIGKLGEDKKAWLAITFGWNSAHAYNATWSAVTGYSPHYLMFGQWPRLLVNFVFPTIGSSEGPHERDLFQESGYLHSICERPNEEHPEGGAGPIDRRSTCQQKRYYDQKVGTVNLKPGNLVLVKVDTWKGKKKIKDRWDEETWEVSRQIVQLMCPPTKWWTSTDGHESSTKTDFFSSHQRLAFPYVWATVIHGTGVPVPPLTRLPP